LNGIGVEVGYKRLNDFIEIRKDNYLDHENLLILLGNDFEWRNAKQKYQNIDNIIEYYN
jgi:hypothetical protein